MAFYSEKALDSLKTTSDDFSFKCRSLRAKDLTISVENYEHLLDRISKLENKVEKQERLGDSGNNLERQSLQQRYFRKCRTFESRIAKLEVQVSQFREQSLVESRVISLEKKVLSQQSVIEKQQVKIEKLKTMQESEDADDKNIEKEKNVIKPELELAERNGGRIRRAIVEVPVAFTAVLDHNVDHSGIDQTIVFNKVLLNDGNAYNAHTGILSVPRQGMYMFYFVFASGYAPHNVWMHIVVNGQSKAAGVANTLRESHDAQGSNLVILHLHPGDSVWVATYANADVKVYGSPGFTTFSGVLLYEY